MREYVALSNTSARGRLVRRGETLTLTEEEASVRPVEPVKKKTARKKPAQSDDE